MEILNLTANTGNKETILKGIEQMTRENYLTIVNDYILKASRKEELSDFEKGYVKALDRNLHDLGRALLGLEYGNKTLKEMLDVIIEWGISGPYSFESYIDNYELDDFIRNTNVDAEKKFEITINFMKNHLEKYCLEIETTEAEKARAKNQKSLDDYRATVKHYQEKIAELEKILG